MGRLLLAAIATLLVALCAAPPAAAQTGGDASAQAAGQGWRQAERARQRLFDAQTALAFAEDDRAASAVRAARSLLERQVLRRGPPGARVALRDELARAGRAAAAGDEVALAAARGGAWAQTLRIAADVAVRAAGRGEPATARRWLLLRDFRTATRFTRPGVDATLALRSLAAGRSSPTRARLVLAKDLLDAYQAKLRELDADAEAARRRGFRPAWAEAAAQAAGYFAILRPRYVQERGAAAAEEADERFAALRASAVDGDQRAFARARAATGAALDGFTAAPFTPEEQARRANQLEKFVSLVPIEYRDGTEDGRVTVPFEMQEARAFLDGAASAFADLSDAMSRRDRARTRAARDGLARLDRAVTEAVEGRTVVDEALVEREGERVTADLLAAFPEDWKQGSDESDFDLIDLTLDRLESAVASGQYQQAEQARLEMYAFFEFGPELRLRPFDPQLAAEVEGLVWFGARDSPGMANLIAQRAPISQVREARAALDEGLDESAATLGDGASRATIVTNAAVIVFREGLEAVLILAAITASLIGANRRKRRPILVGAAVGLVASAITWVIATTLLDSLSGYGEKLEAVVGVVAIGVLLLVMNWFFHRVYWTSWIAGFHTKRRELLAEERSGERAGFWSAQVLGFGMLGLTSVYREGFETVLFLQSLQLSAGTATVLEGVALGLVLVGAVAVATFALQRKLPYKRMLWVTGVLLGAVLVVLVGQTTRTFQGVGWLSISPIDVDLPYWLGTWLGVFPTWETMLAQVLAAAFVIGSYFAAEWVRVKGPARRRRREAAARAAAGDAEAAGTGTGAVDAPATLGAAADDAAAPSAGRVAGTGRAPRAGDAGAPAEASPEAVRSGR